jgi:hypothetical protein
MAGGPGCRPRGRGREESPGRCRAELRCRLPSWNPVVFMPAVAMRRRHACASGTAGAALRLWTAANRRVTHAGPSRNPVDAARKTEHVAVTCQGVCRESKMYRAVFGIPLLFLASHVLLTTRKYCPYRNMPICRGWLTRY